MKFPNRTAYTGSQATQKKTGSVRFANSTESADVNVTDLALSPATLQNAPAASTTRVGVSELATDAEAIAASSTTVVLTPSNMAAMTATNMTAMSADKGDVQAATSAAVFVSPSVLPQLKDGSDVTCKQSPLLQTNATTGGVPTGATGDVNVMQLQDDTMEQFILGAGQTIIAPRMAAAGLLVSLDLTDDEGAEYNWGARNNAKHAFTIGTSPAFFLEWNFTIADVTGADPIGIGFRKVEANNAALASYTDFAFIGVSETDNSATVSLKTRLNSGSVTTTDTTDAWTDGQTHRLKILVSAAGVVTYEIDGAAPTATAAFTFDDADVVMPFFHLLHGTTAPGAVHWVDYACGVQ